MMEPPPPPEHHFGPGDPHTHLVDGVIGDEFEPRVEYEERTPAVQQRLSAMSLHDSFQELHPRAEKQRPSVKLPITPDYLYYRFNKDGEDWGSAIKSTISAPIEQIEKKARKGKGDGTVLEQMTRMSPLRRGQIEQAVQKANAHEAGTAHWEVAYIKSKKVLRRNQTLVVPEMDVILARTKRPKARVKPISGEIVNLINAGKPAKGKDKEKKYSDDSYHQPRKDSGLGMLVDPIADLPVFDMDGRPRDELGPIHFTNAGLPPQIPREKPLGERKKEDKGAKRDKSQKRSKSRDRGHPHEDGIFAMGAGGEFGEDPDPPPVEVMFDEGPADDRGRRGKSPHEHPEVVGGDLARSYSRRRRQAHSRGQSREKSRSRRGSVHFPVPQTQQHYDIGSSSSEVSESSHYGFDYAESSNTSLGSPGGVPRRGSLVYPHPRPDTVYKTHHRGPARSVSYADRPYDGEQHIVTPARSRRNSYLLCERPLEGTRYERPARPLRQTTMPILERRQIRYHDPGHPGRSQEVVAVHRLSEIPLQRYVPADSSLPMLHYPDEEGDFYIRDEMDRQSSRAEDYQREVVREDFLKQREQVVSARERDLALREEELMRLRRQPEREYYDVRRERRAARPYFY